MENKNTIIIIVIAIIVIAIAYFLYKSSSAISSIFYPHNTNFIYGTISNNNGSVVNTGTGINTGAGSNNGTGSGTGTTQSTTNKLTLKKATPVYYQHKPSQPGYPYSYSNNPVSGITFPAGKVVTIVKVWTSQSGQGKFYETTEDVSASVLDKVTAHYFIKESDL